MAERLDLSVRAIHVDANTDVRRVVVRLTSVPPVTWEMEPEQAVDLGDHLRAAALKVQIQGPDPVDRIRPG